MRKILIKEQDINTSPEVYQNLMVYQFRNTQEVPIADDTFVSLNDFNKQSEESGMTNLTWAEFAREGIFVYVKNNIGLSDTLIVSDIDEFIFTNPEGLWSQYQTITLKPLGYIENIVEDDGEE
jgi:hypothetical protein